MSYFTKRLTIRNIATAYRACRPACHAATCVYQFNCKKFQEIKLKLAATSTSITVTVRRSFSNFKCHYGEMIHIRCGLWSVVSCIQSIGFFWLVQLAKGNRIIVTHYPCTIFWYNTMLNYSCTEQSLALGLSLCL